jgi:hypothetical protein
MIKAAMLVFQKPPSFGPQQTVDSTSERGAGSVYPKTDVFRTYEKFESSPAEEAE